MADDLKAIDADLYDQDYLAWAERQASLLRARAVGLDYDNLAEEVDDLGKSEFYGCQSRVERIIEHFIKLEWVDSPRDRAHWRGEIAEFRQQLDRHLSKTIRNRLVLELPSLFQGQLKVMVRRELISDADVVKGHRPEGYTWAQITDEDWYPEPRT